MNLFFKKIIKYFVLTFAFFSIVDLVAYSAPMILPMHGNLLQKTCGGTESAGSCWYFGSLNQSCTTVCSTHGGYNSATQTTGQTQCNTIIDAVTAGPQAVGAGDCNALYGVAELGCCWSGLSRLLMTGVSCSTIEFTLHHF